MTDSPITKLLRQLKPLVEQHEMSMMATKRYPEYPEVVKKATIELNAAEILIEDTIRTWVERHGPRKKAVGDDRSPS